LGCTLCNTFKAAALFLSGKITIYGQMRGIFSRLL
jgi:hypothetical protein